MTRRLAEVAKYVGVSEATVSRVLNSKPGISDSTRAAVLTALDVLGYDRPAKLRGERARLVGLILPELANPIFPAFAEVVAGDLAKRGFTPVLCTRTANGVSEADYVDMLLDQHVSGVLFCGGHYAQADADHEHYRRLRERGLPAVLVNAAVDDLGLPAGVGRRRARRRPGVSATWPRSATSGSASSSARPTTCRRPASCAAFIAQPGSRPARAGRAHHVLDGGRPRRRRPAGQARRHRDDLRQRPARARCDPGRPPARPQRCRATSRSSASTTPSFMNCTDPPLTTVRQPIEAMGQAAVALLVNQIAGQAASSDELLFEPELVVRGSTGPVNTRVPAQTAAARSAQRERSA